ncbi:MAG: hypothetical protein ACYDIB_13470, partial [Desulfobulbia bacterium]
RALPPADADPPPGVFDRRGKGSKKNPHFKASCLDAKDRGREGFAAPRSCRAARRPAEPLEGPWNYSPNLLPLFVIFQTVNHCHQRVLVSGGVRRILRMFLQRAMDRYSPRMTEELRGKVTDEQEKEILAYIEEDRQRNKRESDSAIINICDSQINRITDCITLSHADCDNKEETDRRAKERQTVAQKATALWAALDSLQRALKKAGHPRPKKETKAPAKDPRQKSLV